MADAFFDTTVFIDYYNGDLGARTIVEDVLDGRSTAAYSPITTLEVWLGLSSHQDEVAIRGILSACEPAPLTDEAAIQAAIWLKGTSPRRAETMFRDALIAATALHRSEPVVSRNTKDFERFGVDVQSY